MPRHRSPFDKGNLLVKFEIEMPETLSEEVMNLLSKQLPNPTRMEIDFDPKEAEVPNTDKYSFL
jgi:hypothetical protein